MSQENYWRGGWANQTPYMFGTRAAQTANSNYGPLNAIADIIGAIAYRNEERGKSKALASIMEPMDVNTSEIVSTPQFENMSLQGAIERRSPAGGDSFGIQPGQFGSDEWIRNQMQAPQPQQIQTPSLPMSAAQPETVAIDKHPGYEATPQQTQAKNLAYEAEYQRQMQEHPEWFDLDGNYMGNTYNMYPDVSDSNLDPLTMRKLNLLSRDFQNQWGEPLGTTSMRRHGNGDSWHDSGQAFDVAGGILETNPEAREWAVNQAAQYGLVPLDEYANPSPHATGGHLHFSDHGDPLTNNYEQQTGQPDGQQAIPQQRPPEQIQMVQNYSYRQPERQLHQATPDKPWTDHYNSWSHVKTSFDSQWAARMKDIVDKNPGITQDKDFMTQVMQMREQSLKDLKERWDKTETAANWDKFSRAENPKEALFFALKAGLNPEGVKLLLSPDWTQELVDLGGKKVMLQQNKYSGEWRINGEKPTQETLAKTMTPQQADASRRAEDKLAFEREKFEYKKQHDADEAAYRERVRADKASAGSHPKGSTPTGETSTQDTGGGVDKKRVSLLKQQIGAVEKEMNQLKSKYGTGFVARKKLERDERYQELLEKHSELSAQLQESLGVS